LIKNLEITNFGPIKHVNVDTNNKNVYIIGPNGTGKSHILRAISLVCTGKHGKTNNNESLIGPHGSDFEIKLTLDNGSILTRTSKTASLELSDGTKYKKVTDVLEHLPFDPILFYNVAFVKQGKINEVFEKDVGKGIIEKLVSLVIDNKVLADGYKDLLAKEKEFKAISNSLASIITDLEKVDYDTQIEEIEAELKTYVVAETDVDEAVIAKQKEAWKQLQNIQTKISEYEKMRSQLSVVTEPTESVEELQRNKQMYDALQKLLEQETTAKAELDKFEKAVEILADLKVFFGLDATLVKATYTEDELNSITKQKEELFGYLTTTYYTEYERATKLLEFHKKYGHIDALSIAAEKEKFDKVKDVISQHVDVVKYLKQYSATPTNVETLLSKKIEECKTSVNNIVSQKEKYKNVVPVDETKMIALAQHWSNYKNYVATVDKLTTTLVTTNAELEKVKSSITMTEEAIAQAEQTILNKKNMENIVRTKRNMLSMLQSNKEKLETNKMKKFETDEQVANVLSWKDVLKEMPGKLRHALLQPVAYHLNKDFQELFSFTLGDVKIDWNNMDIVIGNKIIEQLSGAQEVALGLTMHLALLKAMGEQVPIMLIDEPTQFMDTVHINEVKTYLNYLGRQTQMWICTHEDQIVDNVNSIILNTSNF
jgi:DNA repair exonuclease SbcCD ATPase subunit